MIVTGGWDRCIKIWDTRQPNPVRSIIDPYICGDAIDVHEGYILTGSYTPEKQLQLWDFGTGEWIEDINWNESLPSEKECYVYACQF